MSSELIHYGVKGMKWGVRRAELNKTNDSYTKGQRQIDKRDFGKRGVKRINRRMNKGQTRIKARKAERRRDSLQYYGAVGAVATYRYLKVVGPVLSQVVAQRAETKRGQAAAAAAMGLPRTASTGPNYSKQRRNGVYNISSL